MPPNDSNQNINPGGTTNPAFPPVSAPNPPQSPPTPPPPPPASFTPPTPSAEPLMPHKEMERPPVVPPPRPAEPVYTSVSTILQPAPAKKKWVWVVVIIVVVLGGFLGYEYMLYRSLTGNPEVTTPAQ